ncbi:MAG: hypothetical protein ACLP50_00620 [Solirubrobacteraceae bacterium]
MTFVRCVAIAAVSAAALAGAPAAAADGVSVSRLPDSIELQGTVTVSDQDSFCDPSVGYCGWYGEASQYAISLGDAETGGISCPSVFDITHSIWVGSVIDDPTATDDESFAFAPAATRGPIQICLYTTDSQSGDELDTSSIYAVSKARSAVSLYVDAVRGCRVYVSAYVNDGSVIDGNLMFAVSRPGYRTDYTKWPTGDGQWWFQWAPPRFGWSTPPRTTSAATARRLHARRTCP